MSTRNVFYIVSSLSILSILLIGLNLDIEPNFLMGILFLFALCGIPMAIALDLRSERLEYKNKYLQKLKKFDKQLLEIESRIKDIKNELKSTKDTNSPEYHDLLIESLELQSKLLKQREEFYEMLLI